MITENLSTLTIHKLSQEQYDRELAAGRLDETALYLTPDTDTNTNTIDIKHTEFAPVRNQLDTGSAPNSKKVDGIKLSKVDYNNFEIYGSKTTTQKVEFLLGQIRYYDYDYGFTVTGLPEIDTIRIESRRGDSVYTFYNSDIISRSTQPNWEEDFNYKLHDIYLVIDAGVYVNKRYNLTGIVCRNERTYERLLQITNENAELKYVPELYGTVDSVGITSVYELGGEEDTRNGVTFTRESTDDTDHNHVLIANGTATADFYYPVYEITFNKTAGALTFYGNHESVFTPDNSMITYKPDRVYPITFTNNIYTLHGTNMPYVVIEENDLGDGFDSAETERVYLRLCAVIKRGETFNSTRLEYGYYFSTTTADLLKHHHVELDYLKDSVFEKRATYSNENSFIITAEDATVTGNAGGLATFTDNGDKTFTIVSNMTYNDVSSSEDYFYKFLLGSYTFDDTPYGYVITGIPENLLQWSEYATHLLIETEDGSGRIETTKYNGNTGKIYLKTNDIDGFEAYNSDWYAVKGKTTNIYIAQRNFGSSNINKTFDFNNFKIDKCVSSHEVMKQHSEDIKAIKNRLDSGAVGGSGNGTTVDLSNYATKGDVSSAISGISFPVTKVNNKTGNITLTADDVGALASDGKAADATKADYAASAGTADDTSKLGGVLAENYATKTFVSSEIAKAQLSSGEGTSVDLSNYVTKEDLDAAAKNIDFPVDSVNGRTGVVELTASDIGALPSDGKATSAEYAELAGNSERLNGQAFNWEPKYDSPEYVWGGMSSDPENVYAHITSTLSVGYAESAGSTLNGQTYHNEFAAGSPDYVWGGMTDDLANIYAHAVSEFSVGYAASAGQAESAGYAYSASELIIQQDSFYNSVAELPSKGTPGKVYFVKR